MPKPVSNRQRAEELGVSHTLYNRKHRQGKSDEQIVAEAKRAEESKVLKLQFETYAAAQARKETALANLREIEEAEKRGELLDRKETEAAWSSMISEAKASMLNIGDELGDVLAAEMNPIRCRELVNDKVREALTALAG